MKHFFLASIAVLLCCQKQVAMPQQAAELYGRWFVCPSTALTDSLLSYRYFVDKQDSLAQAAMLASRGPSGAHTTVLADTFNSSYTLGWKTPASFRFDTLYPLVVYLHGGTGTTLTTKGELAYDMLSALADSVNLFLASPSANRDAPWWSAAGMQRILQTIRFMSLCYPIDPDKIFLAGVSDGATGCYLAANTLSDPFAGFIAVSGYGGMLFSFGLKLYPQNLMQRPILNINAGQDRIYPFPQVMQFISWLEQNGVAVEHREYPEEKHGFDYREKEYGNLTKIIRLWSRPVTRKSVSWIFTPGLPNLPENCIGWEIESNSAEASINASWTLDTLRVRATGLKWAACSFPGPAREPCFVSVNGSAARRIRPERPDARTVLALALHQLSPRVRQREIFKITIAR